MDDLDWQYTQTDDSGTEKWCDIARQIESGFLTLLEYFDSDSDGLQTYLDQVALIDWFPIPYLPQSAEEYLDAEEREFAELIDKFPLKPEVLTDKNRVFRQIMVVYCSELLKAKAALKAGLTEKAWWHWSCACYHHGMSQGYYLRTKPADDKRRNGKQGGLAKAAKKRLEVRKACITHLINNRPMGGWTSPQAAVDIVAPIVKDSLKKISEELDVDALLYEWLNDDPVVQQAGGFRMRCTKE
ncbi:MAG: hypothetical protein CVU32_02950 [Betaproteobacteria bacterium HGW-Betaproteobacteria-5]|jgi:hypothetical protein|nr:MAG: hypothetical protein CVU32_02950 [Betaproteobacteria bacterium HGW-Betaproteobacteria-5]PKO35007.1 MAG: hypothetical protein CVU34_05850 [Betaproteobacteria bacterium HGW-Betaproteobacteria-7]